MEYCTQHPSPNTINESLYEIYSKRPNAAKSVMIIGTKVEIIYDKKFSRYSRIFFILSITIATSIGLLSESCLVKTALANSLVKKSVRYGSIYPSK